MELDFSKNNGRLPVIVQHWQTGQVLMLGYMNSEALVKTIAEDRVTFFSRSKNRLWTKGEESGNFLQVKTMFPDCDKIGRASCRERVSEYVKISVVGVSLKKQVILSTTHNE